MPCLPSARCRRRGLDKGAAACLQPTSRVDIITSQTMFEETNGGDAGSQDYKVSEKVELNRGATLRPLLRFSTRTHRLHSPKGQHCPCSPPACQHHVHSGKNHPWVCVVVSTWRNTRSHPHEGRLRCDGSRAVVRPVRIAHCVRGRRSARPDGLSHAGGQPLFEQ